VRVHDQPRHFIGLVRHHLFFAKVLERKFGQRTLCGHSLFRARSRHAGSTSPLRKGVALASSSRKLLNV